MPRRFRKACCLPLSPQQSRGEPFMSPMIQLQSAAAEHRDVRRRYAASLSPFSPNRVGLVQPLLQALRSSSLPRSCASFRLLRSASCAPGNLDTRQPFSYCYELSTQLRLESVATRTPPPICTSAQCSQTALVLRTVGRRE